MKFTIFYVTDRLAGPREHMFIFKVIQISSFLSQWKNSDKVVVQHFGKCKEKNCVYVKRHFSLMRSSPCRISWTGSRTTGNIQRFYWKFLENRLSDRLCFESTLD